MNDDDIKVQPDITPDFVLELKLKHPEDYQTLKEGEQ